MPQYGLVLLCTFLNLFLRCHDRQDWCFMWLTRDWNYKIQHRIGADANRLDLFQRIITKNPLYHGSVFVSSRRSHSELLANCPWPCVCEKYVSARRSHGIEASWRPTYCWCYPMVVRCMSSEASGWLTEAYCMTSFFACALAWHDFSFGFVVHVEKRSHPPSNAHDSLRGRAPRQWRVDIIDQVARHGVLLLLLDALLDACGWYV